MEKVWALPEHTTKNDVMTGLLWRSKYTQYEPGQNVELFKGKAEISVDGSVVASEAQIYLRTSPDVAICFEAAPESHVGASGKEKFIEFAGTTAQVAISGTSACYGEGNWSFEAKGVLEQSVTLYHSMYREEVSTSRVQFHLLNFPDYLGTSLFHRTLDERGVEKLRTENFSSGRVVFNFDGWCITLDALPELDKRRKLVREQGGACISHVCDLRRADCASFTRECTKEILEFLYWYLSFVAGQRCGVDLVAGYSTSGETLWEAWNGYQVSSGEKSLSWFATWHPDKCLSTSSAAHKLWSNVNKKAWFHRAIAFYLAGNTNYEGVEYALTQSQTTLELLSFVVMCQEAGLYTEEDFDKKRVSERISEMLTYFGLSETMPASLVHLNQALVGKTGPQAITQLRNKISHPTPSNEALLKSYGSAACVEAWFLSQQYCEFVILKLLGYSGRVNDRLDFKSMKGASVAF